MFRPHGNGPFAFYSFYIDLKKKERCLCQTNTLMRHGCQCGHLRPKNQAVKRLGSGSPVAFGSKTKVT
jgi:hypothetical protein